MLQVEGYLKYATNSFARKSAADRSQESGKEDSEEVSCDVQLLNALQRLKKNDILTVDALNIKEGETSPPKRYNSGSMILAMENAGQLIEDEELRAQIKGSGIGTSATRAEILKKLVSIKYLSEGWVVDIDPEIHGILDKRTDPTWPTTWFTPRLDPKKDAFKDVYSVMNNWGANHGAISYGHIGADLITLASMLRIPVCMHNVDDAKIFRPAAWNAFGMDKEGADFRACANFGPIYK